MVLPELLLQTNPILDATMQTVHVVFAGLWTGAVILFALAVLPNGVSGDIRPEPLSRISSRLTTLTRVSAVLLFLTGGHLAGAYYTFDVLLGSLPGYLVLAMLGLWLVMVGLLEVGGSKMRDGLDADKVRTPARDAQPFYQAAAVLAVLLLVDAGLLAMYGIA
ncbi:transporter [Salinirubellus salinus]|uniref:Transporter n=1 Tax=Salinirubellus salinus TaxID=1364945 RepID=A0A9E7R4K9_9EURY|nr:CopD family protein [Salinirubellus salinus]UWM55760.1 transporter [Salinirubellus salinus]